MVNNTVDRMNRLKKKEEKVSGQLCLFEIHVVHKQDEIIIELF